MSNYQCQFATATDKKDKTKCGLNFYGGFPYAHNCENCISKGYNNEAHAAKLFKTFESSHPKDKSRVSGCCDSAENPVIDD